jgi:hypothetical protein
MMLRKLASFITVTVVCGLLAGTSTAAVLIPGGSSFQVNLAALPTIEITGTYAAGAGATLTNGVVGHDISTSAGLFQGSGITAGTSLLTGVALLVNMTMTATNNAATYTGNFASGVVSNNPWGGGLTAGKPNFSTGSDTLCATGCLGAGGASTAGTFNGQIVLNSIVGSIPFPMGAIGLGGTDSVTIGGPANVIRATGGPWVTGKVQITGITTNVLSVPARPGGPGPAGGATGVGIELNLTEIEGASAKALSTMGGFFSTGTGAVLARNTVNVSGTNNLASSAVGGTVTMISPTRIDTGPLGSGVIPGVFRQTFKFVPEPGTVLLLVSGAAGLVALGRKRMKN